jgi:2-C-methyl-D-erythritol 2,4-cyclodiphosphate synthase
MRQNIADALKVPVDRISVKATTEEGLGFTGNEEGIAAEAVCLIESLYEGSQNVFDSSGGCSMCPKMKGNADEDI